MNTPLRVLLVAPSAADAELLLDELRRAGHDVSWELVRGAPEMERAVRQAWDLVLARGDVEGFRAASALGAVRRAGLEAPFLIVETPLPAPGFSGRVERELGQFRLRLERRAARQTLRESESRFRALAENSSDGIFMTDPDGLVVFANASASRVFGRPVSGMIGRSIERLIPGLLTCDELEACAPGRLGDARPFERSGLHSAGWTIPLELSISSQPRGGKRLLTIVARDVSERRRVEGALRESEARKSAMLEAALDAIVTIDADGRVLEFNAAAERIFGYSRDAAVGRLMADLIVPPAYRERHRAGMQRYLATGEARVLGQRLEMAAMRSDGSEFPVELTVTRLPSAGPALFTGYVRDISDRRLAEIALRESEERFRVAAQISTDLVYEWDIPTGKVLFVHQREKERNVDDMPRTREEWERLLHPEDRARVLAALQRTLDGDQAFHEEYRVVHPDGSVRVRIGHGIVLRDSAGRPTKWIGVNKDVTERRRTQAALQESEQKLRTLVTNAPVVLFALDRNGVFTASDGRGLERLGMKPGEIVGRTVWDVYRNHPEVLEHVRRALDGEEHAAVVALGPMAFETRYAPYHDAEGRVAGVIGVANDVTEQRRIEQALRASEARYRKLFEGNLAGVFRSTLDGRIFDCNESFARIFGYDSPAEVFEQPALQFYLRPEDRTALLNRILERQSLSNHEMCARRRDGTPIWVLENATLLEGPEGERSIIEGTIVDITERKRAEEQVKHLAFHDALTGLPNRLLLNDRLTVALAHAHRTHRKLATLYLDLDRFKVINDSLGHNTGDELLRRVAERLRSCVREEDTVARLGGDEFVVLVARIGSEKDAETVARKILASIRLPFAVDERDYFLTTSVGVSVYPNDGLDAETLLQNADTAMYRAKEQGRDNYQTYAPAMNSRAVERLSLENRLRQALQNDELLLHYQPIVDLRDGAIRRAEALLRWRHPQKGLLQPAEFITLAEISGLIAPIGRWVLETACRQVREWRALGSRFTVSVNLSPRQFQQADLVSQVVAALEASGVEPACLDLEITESKAMDNADVTINTLWELRRLGVGISMDDFGTGYSSLNYLKRFPIDRVKLDRSFVRDVITNPEDAAIVRAVIAMAHTLKLVVAAEGVENTEQLAFLRKHRCDEVQGFLFSPPVEPAELPKLVLGRTATSAIA